MADESKIVVGGSRLIGRPIITTQLYKYFSVILLFAPVSDEPEVFLPKYSQTALLHAPHFRWVVNT